MGTVRRHPSSLRCPWPAHQFQKFKQITIQCFFVGRIRFAPGYIAMQNVHQVCHTCFCWIMDGLEKRGLPCPAYCPFCDQASKRSVDLLWFREWARGSNSTTRCHYLLLLVNQAIKRLDKDHQKWSNSLIKTPQCYPGHTHGSAENRRDGSYGVQLGLRASGAPFLGLVSLRFGCHQYLSVVCTLSVTERVWVWVSTVCRTFGTTF